MPSTRKPPSPRGLEREENPFEEPSVPADLREVMQFTPDEVHPQLVSLLRKKKLTPKGQEKFMKELLSAMTLICGPQFVQSMFTGILNGDHKAMRLFAESTALVKAPGGINISMQQNNNNSTDARQARVSFESIARELTTQDASARVIEATPVRELEG